MNLPGIATHYMAPFSKLSVCGIFSEYGTIALGEVDCKRCRKTKVFRANFRAEKLLEQVKKDERLRVSRAVRPD